MNRRKFLGMLGLAPVVPALLKVAQPKQEFWAGTIVPRHLPLPSGLSPHNPIPIHPFDVYLMVKNKAADVRWYGSPTHHVFKINGVFYLETTEVEASPEARRALA